MRGRRIVFISTLTILMVLGIALGSAIALDFSDWEDTWHKIKVRVKGVCEDFINPGQELFKDSGKTSAWIYIDMYDDLNDEFDAFLVTMEENGNWQATPITLSISLGTADDAVLELVDPITVVDSTTQEEVGIRTFFVRLKGTEKQGVLKSGQLKSVAGISTILIPDEGACAASLSFSGKLIKVERVPQEVIDALP